MREILETLLSGCSLTEAQAEQTLDAVTDPDLAPAVTGAVLAALRAKGETGEELRGFALGLRRRALRPAITHAEEAIDVVGTGGDGSSSFNLSTGAALVTAASGQPVIKHGNRAVSSHSGSADVLAALGVGIPTEAEAGPLFERTGFTFLFAPYYHPAMKAVAPVRQALGVRTIFNLAGPLANPARPGYMLVGAFSLDIARVMADALAGMGVERAFVVHGHGGWDEPTPAGPYHLVEVSPGRIEERVEDPADLGLPRCRLSDLVGGNPVYNAASLRKALEGETGPHRDALVLGASLALRVAGRQADPLAAVAEATEAIDEGRAAALLHALAGAPEREDLGVG